MFTYTLSHKGELLVLVGDGIVQRKHLMPIHGTKIILVLQIGYEVYLLKLPILPLESVLLGCLSEQPFSLSELSDTIFVQLSR